MRRSNRNVIPDVGSPKNLLCLGEGVAVYRHKGKWHYRGPDKTGRCEDQFIEVSDPHAILELMTRAYHAIYPAHECADRPNLPCPACEHAGLRALGIKSKHEESIRPFARVLPFKSKSG